MTVRTTEGDASWPTPVVNSEGFPADVPAFAGLSEAAIVAAALACDSERDFNARMAGSRDR